MPRRKPVGRVIMGSSAFPATMVAILLFASAPPSASGLHRHLHRPHGRRCAPATPAAAAAFFVPRAPTRSRYVAVGVASGAASATFRSRRDDHADAFIGSSAFGPPTGRNRGVRTDRRPHPPITRGTAYSSTSIALSSSADDTPVAGEGAAAQAVEDEPPLPSEMRVKEIQSELRSRGVYHSDCFDRDSLVERLVAAREGGAKAQVMMKEPPATSTSTSTADAADHSSTGGQQGEGGAEAAAAAAAAAAAGSTKSSDHDSSFDRDAVAAELRTLRVSELRKRLGERDIRWSNMIEKGDLVNALVDAMERSSQFSVSGELTPGEANDVSESVLAEELGGDGGVPLLLDVYATWCGPCQLMAPQIKAAAGELGTRVRVCKMDSDKFPDWSGRLEVGGLPTTILFDAGGKEVGRQEGALMKDQILEFVRPHL